MTTLLHLSYSPWSEQARWALDLHHVPYKKKHYQPLLGEPGLRKTLGQWRGPVSVPVLLTDEGPIADSLDIARWADAHGEGPPLFPDGKVEDVLRWCDRAQEGMAAGRALSLTRVLAHRDASAELIPKNMRALGPLARAIARAGVARTRRKYGGSERADTEHQATLEGVLDEMSAALGDRPDATLVGELSFADLRAAQVLCFVKPHEGDHVRLGAASREVYGDPELAARYPNLLAWRDELYARYR